MIETLETKSTMMLLTNTLHFKWWTCILAKFRVPSLLLPKFHDFPEPQTISTGRFYNPTTGMFKFREKQKLLTTKKHKNKCNFNCIIVRKRGWKVIVCYILIKQQFQTVQLHNASKVLWNRIRSLFQYSSHPHDAFPGISMTKMTF